jgi:hypothetical protein
MKQALFPLIVLLGATAACPLPASRQISRPAELVGRVSDNYARVRDAQMDITLDTSLQIFGCAGLHRQKGRLFFKAPDKMMVSLEKDRYYLRGNRIRKIDKDNKRYYIRLLYAPDFSVGFNPTLITHNFNLNLLSESTNEAALEGLPKPGVLKNVKKVIFYLDPQNNLLRSLDLMIAQNIKGKVQIRYEKIKGLDVPVATYGRSAVQLNGGMLVALDFDLRGENVRVNLGLSDKLFDPCF